MKRESKLPIVKSNRFETINAINKVIHNLQLYSYHKNKFLNNSKSHIEYQIPSVPSRSLTKNNTTLKTFNIIIPFHENKSEKKMIINRKSLSTTSQQIKIKNTVEINYQLSNAFLPNKDLYQSNQSPNHKKQILNSSNTVKQNPYLNFQSNPIEPQLSRRAKNVIYSQKTKRKRPIFNYSEQKFDTDLKPWEMDKQSQIF